MDSTPTSSAEDEYEQRCIKEDKMIETYIAQSKDQNYDAAQQWGS